MSMKLIRGIVLVAAIGTGGFFIYQASNNSNPKTVTPNQSNQDNAVSVSNFIQCEKAGYQILETFPRQCKTPDGKTYTEEISTNFESDKGVKIVVTTPLSGSKIESPLSITGQVPGSWSFEAQFPIILKDQNGKEIARIGAKLTDDWMTDDLVNFTAKLNFNKPAGQTSGTLVLEKDNPSDLPENADLLKIPVKF